MRYYDVDDQGALVESRTVWSRDPEQSE
jgi:hypothetical protein